MTRSRRTLGRALLVIGSLVIALAGAEVALRAQIATDDAPDGGDDAWRRRYQHMNETIYRASRVPGLVYEPVPGASVEMEYGPAGFDAAGMRDDRDLPRAPVEGVPRVAILGDSIVWSEFLSLEDSIPRRAEAALGERYEVLAFGVTGYDTAQEAIWYERAVRPLAPDVVVLVWCMNDGMIMSGPFERFATPADRARKDAQEAMLARVAPVRRETIEHELERREREASSILIARALGLYERWRYESRYVDEALVWHADPAARARVEAALARLGAAIAEDDAQAILVISPALESWDEYRWAPIHDFVRETAERAGFTVVDPLARWREEHDPSALRIDTLHYDARGARVMGEAIADAVRAAAPAARARPE